jgi:hypothetical protein
MSALYVGATMSEVGWMADEVGATATRSDALNPSTGTSLATVISAAAAIIGVFGQLAVHGSVGFAMLAGFGLAVLAAIVFAHQR